MNEGVENKRISREYFAPAGTVSAQPGSGGKITVTLQGKTIEYQSDGKKTILEELVNLGEKPPYSCTSGACSTCMAKVKKGKVSMDVCYALDDEEIKAGYILTCQAHVTSDELEITYEL
jgi:ring-1,2-phenylacetyl-CoA epoxidase subunit PaaE